jgi:SlyX protein
MAEQRFVDIEIKLLHQEQMLEDLSSVIFRQQQQIDQLEQQVKTLKDQVKSAKDGLEVGPADEKPPHY